MSYDYNALVSSITSKLFEAASLSSEHKANKSKDEGDEGIGGGSDEAAATASKSRFLSLLQQAVDELEKLSTHCPLTPLLWMMYADAANKLISASTSSKAMETHENDYQQTRIDLLQLGLQEFPGSTLLHFHACQVLYQVALAQIAKEDHEEDVEKALLLLSLLETRIEEALNQIALSGEHDLLLPLYRLQSEVLILTLQQHRKHQQQQKREDVSNNYDAKRAKVLDLLQSSLVERARSVLQNHTLSQEVEELLERHGSLLDVSEDWLADLHRRIDQGRRLSSKLHSSFDSHVDDIESALDKEGLLRPRQQSHEYFCTQTDCLRWLLISQKQEVGEISAATPKGEGEGDTKQQQQQVLPRTGMGYGGIKTAHAYIQYALAIQRYKPSFGGSGDDNGNDDQLEEEEEPPTSDVAVWKRIRAKLSNPSAVTAIYERGVADCPTVEALWRSYLRHALEQLQLQQQQQQSLSTPAVATAADTSIDLTSLLHRAVRNCPYSLVLAQERLQGPLHLANAGRLLQQQHLLEGTRNTGVALTILDPDTLVDFVQETLDAKFLQGPDNFWALYQTVLMVIKRRILFLLSLSSLAAQQQDISSFEYDEAEPFSTKSSKDSNKKNASANPVRSFMNEQDLQEALDLCEDLVELYDEIEARLRKTFGSWSQGRSLLWNERAQTEALLIRPLLSCGTTGMSILGATAATSSLASADAHLQSLACEYAEKAVRAHNPPHPDVYLSYIRHFAASKLASNASASDATSVARRIRNLRSLYSKAVNAVGKSKPPKQPSQHGLEACSQRLRDYETALSSLCYEWLEFERTFGSDRSLGRATKATQKKLDKAGLVGQQQSRRHDLAAMEIEPETAALGDADDGHKEGAGFKDGKHKRKLDQANGEDQDGTKKHKMEEDTKEKATVSVPPAKATVHKVRVGKLDYPAHPFTVRVSNLSPETQDMDLVDTFRPKCGVVVHARILREKTHYPQHSTGAAAHPVGKSKGWGLVQFEERESVEKALALNDLIGLHERVLTIERSHMPAALLVPQGMHRVKEKGHGKYSKRNEKHKQQKSGESGSRETGEQQQTAGKPSAAPLPTGSVLSFRPRAVPGGRKAHQKPKISLDESTKKP